MELAAKLWVSFRGLSDREDKFPVTSSNFPSTKADNSFQKPTAVDLTAAEMSDSSE